MGFGVSAGSLKRKPFKYDTIPSYRCQSCGALLKQGEKGMCKPCATIQLPFPEADWSLTGDEELEVPYWDWRKMWGYPSDFNG
eukprot:g77713.t1